MRAIIFDTYGEPSQVLRVGELPRPVLKRGQVLVKVAAAPINPSDTVFVEGSYGFKWRPPTAPGLEGAGTVVEANAGAYGRWLIGKRVACSAAEGGPGTWAEFVASRATDCVPLPKRISLEQAATLQANPLTAVSLVAEARRGRHRAAIQTAAASALGRMIVRLAAHHRLPLINIVRRPEQAEMLRADGATDVLCSTDAGFDHELRMLCATLGATIAFDPIGGETSARLLRAMPDGARLIYFGGLGGDEIRLDAAEAVFHDKSVEGFWLPTQMRKVGRVRLLQMIIHVRRHADTIFQSHILAKLPFERIGEALQLQRERASEGKVLLVP